MVQTNWLTSRCKKLQELPLVFTDWQQTAWRPDCDRYDCGRCDNPKRACGGTACPFDGKKLPLREVAVETPISNPLTWLASQAWGAKRRSLDHSALELAVKLRIIHRTGRRIQALAIELKDGELVVSGTAPCYYVKQLALQGVLDVLKSGHQAEIECDCRIVVQPPEATEPSIDFETKFQSIGV